MSNLKLGVEVVSAHDLMAKDGQGSSDTFVELHFDGQRFRTATKEKDLNPVWNEQFYFNVSDPNILSNLTLDACIYNLNKANNSKSFLGKVRLTGTSFVPYSDAVVLHYPLEKRGFLSRVKGELGLKVFVTDDPSIKSSNPLPAMESSLHTGSDSIQSQEPVEQVQKFLPNLFSNEKSRSRQTFHHLPNANPAQPLQHNIPSMATQSTVNYGMQEMKSEPQAPKVFQMYSGSSPQSADYTVRETSPHLGGGRIVHGRVIPGDRPVSTYDLVEQMRYLFVRVVKARDLPSKDVTGSLDPYVEVKVGNFKGTTKYFEKKQNPEWNEVFAFAKDNVQSTFLEVVVKDKDTLKDDFVGLLRFDLREVPTRVPPDSPLAPEWYRLEDKKGERVKGELMLAVWYGTQADEAFPDAWHSDTYTPNDSSSTISSHTRSKVYHSPRLWYVRVNIIEAQDLVVSDKSRFPDAYVKVQIGNQQLKTKPTQVRSLNAVWKEEFLLVASEPFEELLVLSVEDRVSPTKEETIGKVVIPLSIVERRADDRIIRSRWVNIEKSMSAAMDGDQGKKDKFSSKLHLSVCLDGGYHVLDEPTHYSSDLRPTAKQLWKPSIGVLELGILNADGLHPIKTRGEKGTADTYCVAKYGHKWVRTRTIMNSLSPKYNEQYTWEVYDPATVITVGVFDDSHVGGSNDNKDLKVGKVRIRISTLETGRVYTHSYPLLVLHPSGVKKMGELHLAIRFSCTSLMNMMMIYSRPVLPKMHYIRPLNVMQQDWLRHQAVSIVAARLGRAEPPLRREVVEYMSDAHSHLWSMRRSKANFFRVMSVFSGLLAVGKWFGDVCMWKNPITAVLVHVLFVMLVCFPELILPTVFLYLVVIGFWNLRFRPKTPPHMNTRISYADSALPDELDEEFDTFPTQRAPDIVRVRYDRLRVVAGKIQNVVGDVASQLERVQALLSWRDTRATIIFVIFCFVSAIVLYVTPFQVIVLLAGFYFMRHPRFRRRTPGAPLNFFRRLPARTDIML
ncbi:FT-interacting protein 3-like [Juglans microcarpa x Juglans regia]|uniref:FT-interacting protein 3-like n=1 Tax=Juglans microcarpa x Juglans regia TaxID=2249226 RepID=UPI001B7F3DC3|nr:FT-interacting protein 3-like [Juglans microcarpa x Juglans regia]XP_040993345.1 FT-interacting protein 3-like [Juglans microcarpa x Juglans regia]